MPRSFLVKKPSSHRIPNYGQLLEAQSEIQDSCGSCVGLLSLFQKEGSAVPKSGIGELWDTVSPQTPVDIGQTYTDSLLCPGIRERDDLSVLVTGLPLKDTMNNLNLPFRIRASDEDRDLSGLRFNHNFSVQREPSQQPDTLGCSDCHRMYPIHKPRHCHGPARRLFSCQHCAKAYTSLGALKMHIRTHTLPCTCRICGKAFSRPWLLQGHIRTHTGEKPFSCLHCGRGFADRSNLRAHLQTHSEVKRYRCPGCGKTFSRVSLLAKHRDGCCCPVS
ncbi:zinc finger protein SNAI3 [Discoglossus pictus]